MNTNQVGYMVSAQGFLLAAASVPFCFSPFLFGFYLFFSPHSLLLSHPVEPQRRVPINLFWFMRKLLAYTCQGLINAFTTDVISLGGGGLHQPCEMSNRFKLNLFCKLPLSQISARCRINGASSAGQSRTLITMCELRIENSNANQSLSQTYKNPTSFPSIQHFNCFI